MNRNVLDRGRRRGVLLGLVLAVAIGFPAQARADIWKSTFGQKWFYESAAGGQALAGTWWEGSLQPGTTYRISFRVKQIKGTVGLFVGAQSVKQIKRTGRFSFEFPARDQKRRMIFTALNGWAMADVTEISVVRSSGESPILSQQPTR